KPSSMVRASLDNDVLGPKGMNGERKNKLAENEMRNENAHKALEMLAKTSDSIPLIFLITDRAVENERRISNLVKSHLTNGRL
ncbi:hypothetical protein U1Q18_040871, partial [Sarracenia purpurea var. burkii]